jgi:hypothetical protein
MRGDAKKCSYLLSGAQDFFDGAKCRDLWTQMVKGPDQRLGKAW